MVWLAKHVCLSHTHTTNFPRSMCQRFSIITHATLRSMAKNLHSPFGIQPVCFSVSQFYRFRVELSVWQLILLFVFLSFNSTGQEDYERLRPLSYPNVSFQNSKIFNCLILISYLLTISVMILFTDGLLFAVLFDRKSNLIWQCAVEMVSGNSAFLTRRSHHPGW